MGNLYEKPEERAIPEEGICLRLKAFDSIKVFRTVDEEDYVRYNGVYLQDSEPCRLLNRQFADH